MIRNKNKSKFIRIIVQSKRDHVILNSFQDRIVERPLNLVDSVDVQKKAFTIAEFLLVLVIVGIFAVAAAPTLTKKQQRPAKIAPHGQFDCYINGNTVYQRTIIEKNISAPVAKGPIGSSCTFKPSKKAAYYVVTLIGGGGGGTDSSNNCGQAAKLMTMFLPSIEADIVTITPGKGGDYGAVKGQDGNPTSLETTEVISTPGGIGGSSTMVLTEGEISDFDSYRESGGYAFNVDNSGNGGGVGAKGSAGAALIVW